MITGESTLMITSEGNVTREGYSNDYEGTVL